ncbi:IS607 family transposase [Sporosarcina sp. YIM B06819]|uniref:IS607 family transposase n=1 Tax=Sporosarcina sp. YIM B06819 TaxID=3081769 RepID=UPI00298C6955|nr:IS607 family transposase [Sporosarcina sp. YIM B06819]
MEKLLLMKEAVQRLGVTTKTIQRWDKEGKIRIVRTPGGRRRIPLSEVERLTGTKVLTEKKMAIYTRVSSNEQKQKGDLQRQADFVREKMESSYTIVEVISEVGSGLNDKRKGLLKLMRMAKNGEVTDIAVRYKDRLTRFGYGYLEEYFKSYDVTIHVLDAQATNKSVQEELADDLISIITSFSGKLYGLRSEKHKELKETVEEAIIDVPYLSNQAQERNNRPTER